ncbi:MAG TPA: hypothetical protein VFE51_19805 [Verrucomicrobiae bacterium]|nr:hypothetical protein [Verrucomicrobiae bacterium]
MKKLLFSLCVTALFCNPGARADDLDSLSGKWSVKKLNNEGQNVTQTIEIKKNKFIFQILGADDALVLYAEGDFTVEKLGPFSAARFSHIRAGSSASNLDDVDDVYVSIYVLDGDSWTMATNFDRPRDGQKPSLDIYHHMKAAKSKSDK